MDSTDEKFSALAAAACFVHPTVCEILVNVDVADGNIQELLKQAEDYVVKSTFPHTRQEDQSEDDAEEEVIEEPEAAPSSKQPVFRFLSKCLNRKPPQPASGNRSSSTRKNFHIPSLRTQEQTSGWIRVTVFITV